MNAIEQLGQLASKPKKAVKKDRPTINVPVNALEAFKRMTGANAILDIVEARKSVESGLVYEILLDSFADTLFENGNQPANPRLEIEKDGRPDISGLFQVQARFKFNIMEGDTPIKDRLIQSLVAAGFTEEKANKLVDSEIDTTSQTSLRPFNELVLGHYVEKEFVAATEQEQAIGAKLLAFVMGQDAEPLSEEERDLVIMSKESVKVKGGFLERLKTYCDSAEDVKAVFRIVQPIHFVSGAKFGINDTPEQLVERMTKEFADILGVKDMEGNADWKNHTYATTQSKIAVVA